MEWQRVGRQGIQLVMPTFEHHDAIIDEVGVLPEKVYMYANFVSKAANKSVKKGLGKHGAIKVRKYTAHDFPF
jgi:hypothetical protein